MKRTRPNKFLHEIQDVFDAIFPNFFEDNIGTEIWMKKNLRKVRKRA